MAKKSKILKYLHSKFTRKEIKELTGLSETTQRRYEKKIPKKGKYKEEIERLEQSRKTFTKYREKESIYKAVILAKKIPEKEIETSEFIGGITEKKDYLRIVIPVQLTLAEFSLQINLLSLRQTIRNNIQDLKRFLYMKCNIEEIEIETQEILNFRTVTSLTDQIKKIEKIMSDLIVKILNIDVEGYDGDIFIQNIVIYQFNPQKPEKK